MIIRRILIILIGALLLNGCASMLGQQRKEPVPKALFRGIKAAAFGVPALLTVPYGDSERVIIKEKVSPRIRYDDSTDYFEIIDIEVKEQSNFTFVIFAPCDCLGFRKWAVRSESFLIAPDGQLVELNDVGDRQARILTGIFSRPGTHKLIVIAKSKFNGQLIGRISGQLTHSNAATNFGIPMVAHPTGTVLVEWVKELP